MMGFFCNQVGSYELAYKSQLRVYGALVGSESSAAIWLVDLADRREQGGNQEVEMSYDREMFTVV